MQKPNGESDLVSHNISESLDGEFESEADLQQGCWQKFLFFTKHSFRDVSRHPCHFCLAFCSVFIVVLSTLVVNTVVDQGPIIFVNLAQGDSGEMDVWYSGLTFNGGWEYEDGEMNLVNSRDHLLNYTQVTNLYDNKYNLAPRSHFFDFVRDDWQALTENYLLPDTGSIYFIDLEREAEIGVGT